VATPEEVDVRVGLDAGNDEHFAKVAAGVTTELTQAA
jgi:hypothetical protein